MEEIFEEIRAERAHQDAKWGGPDHDDDQHIEDDWMDLVREYARGESTRASKIGHRERLVKIAALAVVAIQSYDRIRS